MKRIERDESGRYLGKICVKHPDLLGQRQGSNGICISCSRKRANQSEAGKASKRKHKASIQNYRAIESKRWRDADPERAKDRNRRTNYRVKYGMELEEVEKMFEAQNYCCAICHKPTKLGGKLNAKVDHCHSTGKVRGILCHACNIGIGFLEDNILVLESAIAYLKRSVK